MYIVFVALFRKVSYFFSIVFSFRNFYKDFYTSILEPLQESMLYYLQSPIFSSLNLFLLY